MDFKKTKIEDLVADAKTAADKKAYLKELLSCEKPNYLKVKKAYFLKFYPNEVPVAKAKAKSMKDWLAELD